MNTFVTVVGLVFFGCVGTSLAASPLSLTNSTPLPIPVSARNLSVSPVPASIQKYTKALADDKMFVVDVTRLDGQDSRPVETAHLVMQGSQKAYLEVQSDGKTVMWLSCDGKTLWWWDGRSYVKRPAPASLANLDHSAVLGSNVSLPLNFTANVVLRLFADPARLTKLTHLEDKGFAVSEIGAFAPESVPAHVVESFDGDCRRRLWFSDETSLPLKITSDDSGELHTFLFRYPPTPKAKSSSGKIASIPSGLFASAPPAGLKAYAPPPAPVVLEPLSVGTMAPALPVIVQEPSKTASAKQIKSQATVLYFTNIWASPCQMAMPQVEQLSHDLADQAVRIVCVYPVDQYETLAQVTTFLQTHAQLAKISSIDSATGAAAAASRFHVNSYPFVYVINASGQIAASVGGYSPEGETRIKAEVKKLGAR